MIFDSWARLAAVAGSAVLVYVWVVLLLRVTGKRTLAKLNAFDFVVTVALGSALSTILLSEQVPVLDGIVGLTSLVALQLIVAWMSVRVRLMRRLSRSDPVVLVRDGQIIDVAIRRERILVAEVEQAVRSAGAGSLDLVGAVVLETDGSLSVITRGNMGSGGAIPPSTDWR